MFAEVGEAFGGGLDLLVHSVAFAAAEDLAGRFTDTPRDSFWLALDVSAYSLVACARAAEPLMEARGGGSILTMTYLGGERAVPHYNVMGVAKAALDASVRYLAWDLGQKNIRVNAVSAGPVRTLAARSIAGFPTMEAIVEERAPLHRQIDADDVGAAAAYLLSDAAANVTGDDALRRRRVPLDGHVATVRHWNGCPREETDRLPGPVGGRNSLRARRGVSAGSAQSPVACSGPRRGRGTSEASGARCSPSAISGEPSCSPPRTARRLRRTRRFLEPLLYAEGRGGRPLTLVRRLLPPVHVPVQPVRHDRRAPRRRRERDHRATRRRRQPDRLCRSGRPRALRLCLGRLTGAAR